MAQLDPRLIEAALRVGDDIEQYGHDQVLYLQKQGVIPRDLNKARLKFVAYGLNMVALAMANDISLDRIQAAIRDMYREATRTERDLRKRKGLQVIDGKPQMPAGLEEMARAANEQNNTED